MAQDAAGRYGTVDQIGYLVENLDASVQSWINGFGVGPWTVFRNVTLEGWYCGQPTSVTIDVALSYQGDIQIELIQATNAAPSPYRNDAGAAILGVHHIAWVVDDLDAAVARAEAGGMTVAFRAGNPATQVAYMMVPGQPGILFEFIHGEGMRAMIDAGIAAARVWDGRDPVQVIDFTA